MVKQDAGVKSVAALLKRKQWMIYVYHSNNA